MENGKRYDDVALAYLSPIKNGRFATNVRNLTLEKRRRILASEKARIESGKPMQDPLQGGALDDMSVTELVQRYLPLIDELEARGVNYCVVGGLGVILQQLNHGVGGYRVTMDIDFIVPGNYDDDDFVDAYVNAYAETEAQRELLYSELMAGGTAPYDGSETPPLTLNSGFVGVSAKEQGVDGPSVDLCRTLNGRTAEVVKKERVEVLGRKVWVATAEELADMKLHTIGLYRVSMEDSPRPQDFIDLRTLNRIRDAGKNVRDAGRGKTGRIAALKEAMRGRFGRGGNEERGRKR